MDIFDWFIDNALYCLPDGTIVRAELEERDDTYRWVIFDLHHQRRFIFIDGGHVRAYVWDHVPVRALWLVPCDLTVEDLRPYIPASGSHQ